MLMVEICSPMHRWTCALLALTAFLPAVPSRAVVVALDNTTTYTQPPASDDFGFASVGTVWNSIGGFPASGVYLGDRWVISAFHNVTQDGSSFVFGPVTFGGLTFAVDPSTATRLHTAPQTLADLAIFRLTAEPSVVSASLSGTTPTANSSVRMMGNGVDRESTETNWVVVNGVWTEVPTAGTYTGYKLLTTRALRWGTNTVETGGVVNIATYGTTQSFRMDFDRVSGEGMATTGDSGGGVFVKRAGSWELAGIMLATAPEPGQPGDTVVYGNDIYAGNIAAYRDEIVATMASVPEPASGLLMLTTAGMLCRRRRDPR
jgi:hypothetical protein